MREKHLWTSASSKMSHERDLKQFMTSETRETRCITFNERKWRSCPSMATHLLFSVFDIHSCLEGPQSTLELKLQRIGN